MGTSHQIVRNAIGQAAKPLKPGVSSAGHFVICHKCGTSLDFGADPHVAPQFKSNTYIQSRAEIPRFFELDVVVFGIKQFPQTRVHHGDLYGFPTAARGSAQVRLTIQPSGVTLARSRLRCSLPLAREAIPYGADLMHEVTTSVWRGCNLKPLS